MIHCHTEFHADDGMMLILKEGEVSEMATAPPGMRRCGNWPSDVTQDDNNSSSGSVVTNNSRSINLH